jgi:hypothetical protein
MTLYHARSDRSIVRFVRCLAAVSVPCILSSCENAATAPPGPPYLAIVTALTKWPGAAAPAEIKYRIRDVAGLTPFEREVIVSPTDTIILPVPPGSYVVNAIDIPTRCVIPRGGAERGIALSETDNTGLIRYSIECRGFLGVTALTDGADLDKEYIYRLRRSDGTERLGILAANDTVTLNDATPGDLEVDIAGVAPNCIITSDGGSRQRVTIAPTGGAAIEFRVICSDAAQRPKVLAFTSSYSFGASIFQFRVFDPDDDISGYVWDITDCAGNSVLPEKRERTRRSLRGARGGGRDTLTVIGAYELGLPPEQFEGKCTELRVFDERLNYSTIMTHRIGSSTGAPPAVRFFNATLQGQVLISSTLAVVDPDDDVVGHFVLVRLRDGVLTPPDGLPDLGSMDPAGYTSLDVPNIPTNARIKWDDVYSVIVYIIDKRGNAIRAEDDDIFR